MIPSRFRQGGIRAFRRWSVECDAPGGDPHNDAAVLDVDHGQHLATGQIEREGGAHLRVVEVTDHESVKPIIFEAQPGDDRIDRRAG